MLTILYSAKAFKNNHLKLCNKSNDNKFCRRQLAFLEVSFTQTEERMKEDSDKLIKFYSEKISWLNDHHLQYKKIAEENLNSLTERHKAENDILREQHLDNVKVLQEHHAALMENVK